MNRRDVIKMSVQAVLGLGAMVVGIKAAEEAYSEVHIVIHARAACEPDSFSTGNTWTEADINNVQFGIPIQ